MVSDSADGLLHHVNLWILNMGTEKFNRLVSEPIDQSLLDAYLYVASEGVDTSEVGPEAMKRAIDWCLVHVHERPKRRGGESD